MKPARSMLAPSLLLVLVACNTPPAQPDAFVPADANDNDAGPIVPSWHHGPDYPDPIAFGSAMVLPGDAGTAYLYVMGGASSTFGTLAPFHSEIRRALIGSDGSLGAWEDAGHIDTGSAELALAGFGSIRIYAEDLTNGMAIAGGGGPGGTLPLVLAGYQQVDGSIGAWGSFPPQISATQGGQVFGTFNSFEAHQLALIGGMQGTTPIDHVIIAATMAGTTVMTWRDGPPLPAPRYGHGSAQVGTVAPDIFLVGGAGTSGPINDVLVSIRDTTTLEVTSWGVAGSLTPGVVFPQVGLIGQHVYVIGGVQGDPLIDNISTRVSVATASTGGTGHGMLSAFTRVPGADLPEGRAGGLTAVFGSTIYIVGGMAGADHAPTTGVLYARME
jgi:hypothetical protein